MTFASESIRIVFVMILLLQLSQVYSQQISKGTAPDTTKSNLVIIDKADKVEKISGNEKQEILILTGNVLLHQDSLFMQCDSARKEGNNLLATGNVLLQQWDSLNVFSQTLEYFGNEKDAILRDSVILQSKDQKLFTEELTYNTESKIAIYEQGATLTNDTVFLYSHRGTFYVATDEVYFKDSVYVKSEDFELFADSLLYNTGEQKAYFLGPTLIDLASGSQVYCEGGYFDMTNKKALFTDQAQYVDGEQIAQADSIYYDGNIKQVTMIGNASLEEPGKEATGDTIIYLEEDEIMNLLGNAYFKDSIRTMRSKELIYNARSDKLISQSRSTIDNPPQFLEADNIDFDNKSGLGIALGNIIWRDTASRYTILCEEAHYQDSAKYLKAFGGRPLLINQIEEDSFLLASDTLVSYEEIVNDTDSIRKFQAYYDVKIYKSDLQAICDSLSYSSQDSIFRLYDDPVIWSDTSQFEADSVHIQLANNKIDKIYLNQNAFILNSADQILFNQMKGKEITAFFKEGEIDRMLIKGNASSIYYVLDDFKAYIGVNETLCSSMLLRFAGNTVGDIVFYDNPQATFHPIQEANVEALKLEGFRWREPERPKSKSELTTFVIQ